MILVLLTCHLEAKVLLASKKEIVVVCPFVEIAFLADTVKTVDMQLPLKRSSGRIKCQQYAQSFVRQNPKSAGFACLVTYLYCVCLKYLGMMDFANSLGLWTRKALPWGCQDTISSSLAWLEATSSSISCSLNGKGSWKKALAE